ncbi:SDR family oxidoreductase [Phenylobacterium sp.]|uniref:SDR family NAD(P)-dependent oxidoreductase n=1 Tax=Phenylobacterium sp. TaxID=1871053 RepID=UPI00289A1464|nr:SDR family oxidoreductase [Phenylobacterium sp.]
MGRLSGKTAIITGAGSGIGRAASLLFAAEGAKLVIADKADSVNETARLVAEAGGQAIAVTGDAGDEAFVESLVAKAVGEYGGLDVAWANAGISGGWTGFDEQDGAFWAEILRVNLIGAFLLVKHASRVMIPKEKGSIICTASVAGIRSGAGGSPYSASKAGVINLAQTAANEFYGTGVRVNAICPGLIETGMTQAIFDGARARGNEDKIGQLNPLTRGGVPIEIANAALFLASDESSYVNGQAIVVDGGLSSSHPVVRRKK